MTYGPPQDRWSTFYERNGVDFGDRAPNDDMWIACPCVLPTHPDRGWKEEREPKGAVNLDFGVYKCWNEECRNAYVTRFDRPEDAVALSPEEFLMLTLGVAVSDARAEVQQYREEVGEDDPALFRHDDSGFVKALTPLGNAVLERMLAAQRALSPDRPIVQSYMRARGLDFETLALARAGYWTEGEGEARREYLALPYYVNARLVGVRLRTYDGRKFAVKGSHAVPFGLDQLLETDSRTVVVVEGETDALYLGQVLRSGDPPVRVPVLGTPGAHWRREWTRHLHGVTRVILVPQGDQASTSLIADMRKSLAERLDVVGIPWERFQQGKDVNDFGLHGPRYEQALRDVLGVSDSDTTPVPELLTGPELRAYAGREVRWAIEGLIRPGTKVIIAGEPKVGKTLVAMQLAEALTRPGVPFLGVSPWTNEGRPLRVLFVEEEGPLEEFAEREQAIFGDQASPLFITRHRHGLLLDDPEQFQRFRQTCLRVKPDVLILDPLINMHNQDENSADMMRVMASLNSLFWALPDLVIVLLHHASKGGADVRGHGSIWGNADLLLRFSLNEQTGVVTLKLRGRGKPAGVDTPTTFVLDPATLHHVPAEHVPTLRRGKATLLEVARALCKERGDDRLTAELLEGASGKSRTFVSATLKEWASAVPALVRNQGRETGRGPIWYQLLSLDDAQDRSDDPAD